MVVPPQTPAAFGSRQHAKPGRWSSAPHEWRPSCDLTSSSPAHDDASTATRSHTPALTCAEPTLYCTAVTMANINWRTINIDALDPDSPANFDLSSLTPAVEPISTADVQNTSQQIRQLLRGGDNEGALQGALESPPYGADDKGKVRCLLPATLRLLLCDYYNTQHGDATCTPAGCSGTPSSNVSPPPLRHGHKGARAMDLGYRVP